MEAFALLAQQVALRDPAVGEDQLIGSGSADTHLLLLRTEGEARSSLFYDKRRDLLLHSAALFNGSGNCDDNINVRFLTVGDENLGAV